MVYDGREAHDASLGLNKPHQVDALLETFNMYYNMMQSRTDKERQVAEDEVCPEMFCKTKKKKNCSNYI